MKATLALCGLFLSLNAYALDTLVPTAMEIDTVRAALQAQLAPTGQTLVADSVEIHTSLDVPAQILAAFGDAGTFVGSRGNRVKFIDLQYAKFIARDGDHTSTGWTFLTVERFSTLKKAEKAIADAKSYDPSEIAKAMINPMTGDAALVTIRNHMVTNYADEKKMNLHLLSRDEVSTGVGPISQLMPTSAKIDFLRSALTAQLAAQGMTLDSDSIQLRTSINAPINVIKLISNAAAFVSSHGDRFKNAEFEYAKFLARDKAGTVSEGWTYLFTEGGYSSMKAAQDDASNLSTGDNVAVTKAMVNPYTNGAILMNTRGSLFSNSLDDEKNFHLSPRDN